MIKRIRNKLGKTGSVLAVLVVITMLGAGAAFAAWSFFADTEITATTGGLSVVINDLDGTNEAVGSAVCSESFTGGTFALTIDGAFADDGCDLDRLLVQNIGATSAWVQGFVFLDGTGNPSTDIAYNALLDGSTGAPLEYTFTMYTMDGSAEYNTPMVAPQELVAGDWGYVDFSVRVTDNAEPSTVYSITQGGLEVTPEA